MKLTRNVSVILDDHMGIEIEEYLHCIENCQKSRVSSMREKKSEKNI